MGTLEVKKIAVCPDHKSQHRKARRAAQPAGPIIIHKGEDNRPIPLLIDLNAAIYCNGEGADFYRQPNYVVYVPKFAMAKANKYVRQYGEELLLFRGVSLGFA